jgi:hypothetical protein
MALVVVVALLSAAPVKVSKLPSLFSIAPVVVVALLSAAPVKVVSLNTFFSISSVIFSVCGVVLPGGGSVVRLDGRNDMPSMRSQFATNEAVSASSSSALAVVVIAAAPTACCPFPLPPPLPPPFRPPFPPPLNEVDLL